MSEKSCVVPKFPWWCVCAWGEGEGEGEGEGKEAALKHTDADI